MTATPAPPQSANVFIYEPTFEGWLSAVFAVYEPTTQELRDLKVASETDYVPSLIDTTIHVAQNDAHAERVLVRLQDRFGKSGMRQLLWGFLSEQTDIGTVLFRVVKYGLDHPKRAVLQDLGNLDVLHLAQTVKSVGREKHRMEAFVRFEHTIDDVYFARVEPDFNVLPLIAPHLQNRYQDQHWAIYDLRRDYGIFYDMSLSDGKSPAPLQTIVDVDENALRDPKSVHSEREQQYQQFWQGYFVNVNIKERKNPRLHKQYLPQRYWKYLSEKQVLPNAEHLAKKR